VLGWVSVGAAVLLMAAFLSGAFSDPTRPGPFWPMFVSVPLLAIGLQLLRLGYMGTIARYVAGETTPVASDAVNELAHGTRSGVTTFASALREGLAGSTGQLACPACGTDNDPDASFCDQCGATMHSAAVCSSCQQPVEADARFCDQCGHDLQS